MVPSFGESGYRMQWWCLAIPLGYAAAWRCDGRLKLAEKGRGGGDLREEEYVSYFLVSLHPFYSSICYLSAFICAHGH